MLVFVMGGISMNIRVVLFDTDSEYIENFKKAAVLNYNSGVEYSFFSDKEEFERHMFEKKCDVLLIDDNVEYEDFDGIKIILTDVKGVGNKNGFQAIYKYQKTENIYHAIIDAYAEMREKEGVIFHNGGSAKMVSFISAGGGTGKTTVCFAVAKLLKSMGKEVLYIPLEQFSDLNYTRRGDETQTLSNLFYDVKRGSSTLGIKIKNIIRRGADDLLFIRPMDNPTEAGQLNSEEWAGMLDALSDIDNIDYIFLDHSSGVFRNFDITSEKADTICMVADATQSGMVKATEMIKYIQRCREYKSIKRKLRLIVNKANSMSGEEFKHLKDWVVSFLPDYGTAQMRDVINALQIQEQCRLVIDLEM